MSLLDRLRPKWQHSDPVVREQAVKSLNDQGVLERVASEDVHEPVRLAAIERLTEQSVLARLARGKGAVAVAAVRRLTDEAHLKSVALTSESRDVRELATDKITDDLVLHRIATSDTDPWIRTKARKKSSAPDHTRDFIRQELSKLALAQQLAAETAEFCGSLDEVCAALVGNGHFHINAGVETASSESTSSKEADVAQFLALRREASTDGTACPDSSVFYEIRVWRTDPNTFACQAEEKRLIVTPDAARWGRVSNGLSTRMREQSVLSPGHSLLRDIHLAPDSTLPQTTPPR